MTPHSPTRRLPVASLSLDFDNQWSYMKTRGDTGWESYPSYLDRLVPRVLEELESLDLKITAFIVGADAAREENRDALSSLADAGHEIGNHSFRHEPWLHLYSEAELDDELGRAEEAILDATGVRTRGFRGPGYSLSMATLRVLQRRGYHYDASTLPTYLGPLARAFYFRTAHLTDEQRRERARLFGTFADGRRPVSPYLLAVGDATLLEIPVTTLPGLKLPFHLSYVLYLSHYSPTAARAYLKLAFHACRTLGIGPSLLLHPLDFLTGHDVPELSFFPGMDVSISAKLERVRGYLEMFSSMFDVVPVGEHASVLSGRGDLKTRVADFEAGVGTEVAS